MYLDIMLQDSAMAETGSYDLCPVINWIGSTIPYYMQKSGSGSKNAINFLHIGINF